MQPPAAGGPVQRLDADRVTGQIGAAAGAVSDRERELAAESPGRVLAPLQKRFQRELGVAFAAQLATQAEQLRPQLPVVEDLAVVAEQPAAVLRQPGLDRAIAIDDAQPLGARQQAVVAQRFLDLAPRRQQVQHLPEQRTGAAGSRTGDQRYSAHGVSTPPAARGCAAGH
jgi:hypothetical protein